MMSKITRDLIIEYQNRKINREDLMNATGLSESRIREVLRRANVKVWDLKITDRQTMDRLCNLYKKKKMTRAEFVKILTFKKKI
ncbi:MAG: hypothetical protein KatS3mg036_0587 [Ignavibacterium sp.]|nr:MAG: hypothetical protein KatS3mg036_0587 [Ignavibacterium sp.]